MSDDLPAPHNGTIDGANKFIGVLIDAAALAAKMALVSVAPFFGWPVISQITDFFLGQLKAALYKELSNSTTFLIISIDEAAKYHAYMDELAALKKAQESGDPNDDDEALEKARKALGELIHFHS
jgi:hypothetical protein